MISRDHRPGRFRRGVATMSVLGLMSAGLAGCTSIQAAFEDEDSAAVESAAAAESVWDADVVHVISINVDDDAFRAMVETYESSEEKEWIRADVTIDGTTFRDVGMRLKGNSSLRGSTRTPPPRTFLGSSTWTSSSTGRALRGGSRSSCGPATAKRLSTRRSHWTC